MRQAPGDGARAGGAERRVGWVAAEVDGTKPIWGEVVWSGVVSDGAPADSTTGVGLAVDLNLTDS